jgi:hypothetical protein
MSAKFLRQVNSILQEMWGFFYLSTYKLESAFNVAKNYESHLFLYNNYSETRNLIGQ